MSHHSPARNASEFLAHLALHPKTVELPNHEPSFWLRARITDLQTRWRTGEMLGCVHLIQNRGNYYLVGLWMPQVMACPACAIRLLDLPPEAEHICDRCGATDPRSRGVAWREGSVIVTFGLCSSCYTREVPE